LSRELRLTSKAQMNDIYINLGSEKACLFVEVSVLLVRRLERYPLLYFAVEEALECSKQGYYGIGIIAFSQVLNVVFNEETPAIRHEVAHELLQRRPTKENLDSLIEQLKNAAGERANRERQKAASLPEYEARVMEDWAKLIAKLHGSAATDE
jgi:hypothetical protein